MANKKNLNVVVNNSNTTLVVNEENANVSKSKVTVKPQVLTDSANRFDEEENESPRKKQVFDDIRKLFGFEIFDENQFIDNLISSGCKWSEIKTKVASERKRVNKVNEKIESLTFEMICEKIVNSTLITDFSRFVGGVTDLLTLKAKLINDKKQVILYHSKQSEDGEKFESFDVSVKGLHKPYKSTCYISYAEISTSNIIRAFRCYGYYIASIKRCQRAKNLEISKVMAVMATFEELHKKFGYSEEDINKLVAKSFTANGNLSL